MKKLIILFAFIAASICNAQTPSHKFTAKDGHVIGVNGTATTTATTTATSTCAPVTNLFANAYSNYPSANVCAIYTQWTPGSGSWVSMYVNGYQIKDVSSGYGLWDVMYNSLSAACYQFPGGILPATSYNITIRTWTDNDTTGATASGRYCDTKAVVAIPADFNNNCIQPCTLRCAKGKHPTADCKGCTNK